MVLRAARDTGANFNLLQRSTSPKPDIAAAHGASLISLSSEHQNEFRSPILECRKWTFVQEVSHVVLASVVFNQQPS